MKYEKFIEVWIDYHKQFIKESTFANYKNIINNHLAVDFKSKKLTYFSNSILQKYVIKKYQQGAVDGKPLAIKTVKDIIVVLKLSLRYAFAQNYIESFDLSIKYPKVTVDNSLSIISNNDIRKIIKNIYKSNDNRDYGILIALLTGLRIGEICALRYCDICFKSNIIFIRRTLQRIYFKDSKTKIIETSPKTSASFRAIPLSKELRNILEAENIKDNYFILSNSLKPVEPRLLRKRFDNMLEKNRIKHYKFHSLRHTFATKCVEAKIDYKTISVLLGHSNINTTLNLYVHPNNSQKKRAINKLTAHILK